MSASTGTTGTPVVAVRLPPRGPMHDIRGVRIVWQRDMIRFLIDKPRILASLLTPVLYLFILGSGIAAVIGDAGSGIDYRTAIFPGVLAMTAVFPAVASAGSIVFDREVGFLREMMVAPVRRGSIVVGKCVGGASVAGAQCLLVLCVAGLVGVPYSPVLLLILVLELALLCLTLTACGVGLAVRMVNPQSYVAVIQIISWPMLLLSGALFPLNGLPTWLQVLTRLDPLTYAVDPLRRAVFEHLDVPPSATGAFGPGVTWFGWTVPTLLELAIVALIGAGALAFAIREFRKAD